MSLRINQNVVSLQTYGNLTQTAGRLEKSIEKLSSGLRINRAADDAAGLAISEKMRWQIRGLNRAVSNAQDGISMIQTAEGALNETHSILHRMRELAIQSSNDTLTSSDRLEIQKEVNQLRDDIDRIARNTEFNTKKLLDGSQTALISSSSAFVGGTVNGQVTSGGGDYDVSIALLSAGISQMQRSQIFTLQDKNGSLAQGSTQLQSISQFYNANGVFVLSTPLSVTVSGNSKSTSVTLDAQMTLDNMAALFQNAVNNDSGLGMKNTKIATINTSQTGLAGLGGYIEMISGNVGELGNISVSGDQNLMDAIGMSVSRESANNRVEMTLRDSFGNVRQVKTETDRGVGLLNGIDLTFASQAAQIAGTSGLESGLNISAGGQTFVVQVGGDNVTVGIGSGSWTMEGLARSINHQVASAVSIGGADLLGLEASVVEGEIRLSYNRPATASASVGSSIIISATNNAMGFLNGSYSGFVDGRKDQNRVEWGFTSYRKDIAADSVVAVTIGDGTGNVSDLTVITATRTSGVGSVTLQDMVRFTDLQSLANNQFVADSVAVRIDQIGGAMAFTSTRVGKENLNNQAAITSMVSLSGNTVIGNAAANSSFFLQTGFSEGTTKGTGDKNFRLHVVDSTPQFQIGADQGQSMKVAMADMTSKALGVNNLDFTSVEGAQKALGRLNKAIDSVSAERSKLGAYQNRLEYAVNNLRSTHTNLSAAESRIRDADIAQEMIEFTRNQIVSQSGTAMLAQANLIPQGVLQLLG